MNRREFLATGAALPIIERTELLTKDGTGWIREPERDSKVADFAFYGRMRVTTKDLMRRSWEEAEQDLRFEFEKLVLELRAFHDNITKP